jgi:hypothetical protein
MTNIYIVYLLLSTFVVFLMFYSRLNVFVKALALSATILLGLLTQSHYMLQLGKPIDEYPADKFVYVHHMSQVDKIYVWVWTDDAGNRLHVIPYNQDTAQELQKGKEEQQRGSTQEGKFSKAKDGSNNPGLIIDTWKGPKDSNSK